MTFLKKNRFPRYSLAGVLFFSFVFLFFGSPVLAASLTDAQCAAQATGAYCAVKFSALSDGCDNSTENSFGDCTMSASGESRGCCAPKTAAAASGTGTAPTGGAGSCSGGVCITTGSCPTDKPTPSGACSAVDGGGTCCMSAATTNTNIAFNNPIAFNTVEDLLSNILGTIQGIIVALALVFIVIGALLYITSAGNGERIDTAKNAITAAMIGLALALAAPSFLKEIGTVLGWGAVNNTAVSSALTLSQIAVRVLNFLLSIVGVLAVIMLVIGGITYLTAAGDEERAETGKKIVTYAIIGIAVALAALIIVGQIATLFAP